MKTQYITWKIAFTFKGTALEYLCENSQLIKHSLADLAAQKENTVFFISFKTQKMPLGQVKFERIPDLW